MGTRGCRDRRRATPPRGWPFWRFYWWGRETCPARPARDEREAAQMAEAYILDAVRTPRGRGKAGKGALSGIHPQELLAQTLNELARRTGVEKRDVEDVVIGCVSQAQEQ